MTDKRVPQRILRGLAQVRNLAEGDFEADQTSKTSRYSKREAREVADALDWLSSFLTNSEPASFKVRPMVCDPEHYPEDAQYAAPAVPDERDGRLHALEIEEVNLRAERDALKAALRELVEAQNNYAAGKSIAGQTESNGQRLRAAWKAAAALAAEDAP